MTRSKKIFFICLLIFVAFLLFIIYDISRRTTFPGPKPSASPAQQTK